MNITKEEFIIRLKLVVMADERSCVEDITYWKQDEKSCHHPLCWRSKGDDQCGLQQQRV